MEIWITDPKDPRVAEYTTLKDVTLRQRIEPEQGLYLAESFLVIERALRAGHRPRSFFSSEKWLPQLRSLLAQYSTSEADLSQLPIYLGPSELLEQVTGFHLHRGALAAMHRPCLPSISSILATGNRIAILENLVDHKNVGAAFRAAAALNYDGVLVTPQCADPLYRRSIRVSMGTVFQVPWTRLENWPDLDMLHQAGFLVAALALADDALTLPQFCHWLCSPNPNPQAAIYKKVPRLKKWRDTLAEEIKIAFILGSEGPGLTAQTQAQADVKVIIPMRPGVDSLNVSAAAAVAFYATSFAIPDLDS